MPEGIDAVSVATESGDVRDQRGCDEHKSDANEPGSEMDLGVVGWKRGGALVPSVEAVRERREGSEEENQSYRDLEDAPRH